MWKRRLLSSTVTSCQTLSRSARFDTTSPARSARTVRMSSARPPRRRGLPSFSRRRCAGKSRKGPNTSTESLPSGIHNLPRHATLKDRPLSLFALDSAGGFKAPDCAVAAILNVPAEGGERQSLPVRARYDRKYQAGGRKEQFVPARSNLPDALLNDNAGVRRSRLSA